MCTNTLPAPDDATASARAPGSPSAPASSSLSRCPLRVVLFGVVERARAGENHAGGGHRTGLEGQPADTVAEHGPQHHAAEGARGRAVLVVQIRVGVEPDHREVVVGARRVRDGTDRHPAVAADEHDGLELRRERLVDEGPGAQQRAQPVDPGVEGFPGLHRHIQHGRGRARQVSGDRVGAVDELHRPGGGASLPLRDDEESGHPTILPHAGRVIPNCRCRRNGERRAADGTGAAPLLRGAAGRRPMSGSGTYGV